MNATPNPSRRLREMIEFLFLQRSSNELVSGNLNEWVQCLYTLSNSFKTSGIDYKDEHNFF